MLAPVAISRLAATTNCAGLLVLSSMAVAISGGFIFIDLCWCSRPTLLSPRTSPAGQRLHLHRPAVVLLVEGSIFSSVLPFHNRVLSSSPPVSLDFRTCRT
jgi:hypothetical protein